MLGACVHCAVYGWSLLAPSCWCCICWCQVTDNGLVPLLASVPNLTDLNITGVGVTDAVVRALQTHCPRLQSLHAKGCDYGLPDGAHMKPPTAGANTKRLVSQ